MSDEVKQRWLAKLDYNIEHGDIRESNSALKVAAALESQNQRDELAATYVPAVDDAASAVSPAEIIAQMMATLPLVAPGPAAIDAPKDADAELAKYTNGSESQKGEESDNTD